MASVLPARKQTKVDSYLGFYTWNRLMASELPARCYTKVDS
jgi:hypothetical protein